MLFEAFDVLIANGAGNCPIFEVTLHVFGKIPEGDAHNAMVMEGVEFIREALCEKLERLNHREEKGNGGQRG